MQVGYNNVGRKRESVSEPGEDGVRSEELQSRRDAATDRSHFPHPFPHCFLSLLELLRAYSSRVSKFEREALEVRLSWIKRLLYPRQPALKFKIPACEIATVLYCAKLLLTIFTRE